MTSRRVSARIRDLRKLRRWTQRELSARAGVSQPLISMIENGSRVSDRVAEALAEAFEVSAEDLLAVKCRRCAGSPPAGIACLTCGRKGAR